MLDHYAEIFTEPYPFDSCDQVFVPGLNWGAQENPGCVTYRDEMLPRERITDDLRTFRATVIAHEQAHMWFGNLVTMRWFEDTWLQESFADYLGYRVAEDGAGFTDALVPHEIGRKPAAYVADERRSTHPVAPLAEEVPDVDAALTNFDSISYAKGSSVLRQLVTWLGDDAFLAGVNDHLTRHRFGNATLDDFVASLDGASDRDVREWVRVWLRTSGFDTVRVTRDGDVPVLSREGIRPHRFTVTAYDDRLRPVGSRLVDLGDEPVRLDEWSGAVVVPNGRGETFARVRLDELSWAAVAGHLTDVEDSLTRTVLWATAFDLTETGDLDADGFVDLVAAHLPREQHATLVRNVLQHATGRLLPLRVPAGDAAAVVDRLADACRAGLSAAPDEQVAVALTQGLAATSRDAALLRGWLDAGRTEAGVAIDPGMRWRVVHRLAEIGAADEALVEAERGSRRVGRGRARGRQGAGRPPDARGQGRRVARAGRRRNGLQPDGLGPRRRPVVTGAGGPGGAVRRGVPGPGARHGSPERGVRQRRGLGVPGRRPGPRPARAAAGGAARRRADGAAARLGGRARRPSTGPVTPTPRGRGPRGIVSRRSEAGEASDFVGWPRRGRRTSR